MAGNERRLMDAIAAQFVLVQTRRKLRRGYCRSLLSQVGGWVYAECMTRCSVEHQLCNNTPLCAQTAQRHAAETAWEFFELA